MDQAKSLPDLIINLPLIYLGSQRHILPIEVKNKHLQPTLWGKPDLTSGFLH